jgi:hypothetical protein
VSTPSSDTSAQEVRSACQQVNAALSDGPDPQADPVGYALAQVVPLRRVAPTTSDPTLRQAIDRLLADFEAQYRDTAKVASVNKAADTALARVRSLCPAAPS